MHGESRRGGVLEMKNNATGSEIRRSSKTTHGESRRGSKVEGIQIEDDRVWTIYKCEKNHANGRENKR